IVVCQLNLEITHEDVRGHRRDLRPHTAELQETVHKVSAGRAIGPYTARIAVVLPCDPLDRLIEGGAHIGDKPMQRLWLAHRTLDLSSRELDQAGKGESVL